jgi:hypothetical protein
VSAIGQVMELSRRQPPAGLGEYGSAATDAWLVWYTLRSRARSPEHKGEFADRDHDGAPGLIWRGGSMRKALGLAFGEGDEEARLGVMEWLADSGNMLNIGSRTSAGLWWIRADYQDDRPPRKAAAAAATRSPAGNSPPGRKCRWCPEVITPPVAAARHEKARHPEEFRQAAGYLCPLDGPDGTPCDSPAESPRAMGRHLAAAAHEISDEARRQLLIAEARRRALRRPAPPRPASSRPAPDPEPVPSAPPAPPAERAAPVSNHSPSPETGVLAALETMLAGLRDIRAWVAGAAAQQQQLREERDAALAWRREIEGPLADLLEHATLDAGR